MTQKSGCFRGHLRVLAGVRENGPLMIRGIKVGPTARDPEAQSLLGAQAVSVGRAPARKVEHRACGERAVFGAQPGHHGGDLLRQAEACERDLRQHEVGVGLAHRKTPAARGELLTGCALSGWLCDV